MKIAVLIDKPRTAFLPNEEGFREDEQKRKTALGLQEVISKYYECVILETDITLPLELSAEKIDFVFNLCNGIKGADKLSQVPAFLEFMGVPYTGSSVLGHALASNKNGREFHAGLIGNSDDLYLLPIEEICFDNLPDSMARFYSFEVKAYHKDKTTYICPALIDEELSDMIYDIAKCVFKALSLRDYARLDIRIKDGIPYVLEINSLPGLLDGYSAFTRMANICKLGYEGLVMKILESAFNRYQITAFT